MPDLSDHSDEQLMCLVRDGEDRAFDLLVERHRRGVYHFLLRMLGDEARAEELLSESFLKLYKARRRYQPSARFSTYLYTIARRAALNARAKMHTRKERGSASEAELDAARITASEQRPLSRDPERAAAVSHQLRALREELAQLPASHRDAFLLYYGEGLRCAELADVLQISPAEAKGRLAYTRKLLRERLDPK